jgi:hypothetical protein
MYSLDYSLLYHRYKRVMEHILPYWVSTSHPPRHQFQIVPFIEVTFRLCDQRIGYSLFSSNRLNSCLTSDELKRKIWTEAYSSTSSPSLHEKNEDVAFLFICPSFSISPALSMLFLYLQLFFFLNLFIFMFVYLYVFNLHVSLLVSFFYVYSFVFPLLFFVCSFISFVPFTFCLFSHRLNAALR